MRNLYTKKFELSSDLEQIMDRVSANSINKQQPKLGEQQDQERC
jgi:hypothetical protein